MLRPLYLSVLEKYEFSESRHSQPWYKQSHPVPCLENDRAKILQDIPCHLEKCPRNGANKPVMSVLDKSEYGIVHHRRNYLHSGDNAQKANVQFRTKRPSGEERGKTDVFAGQLMFRRDKNVDLKLGVKSLCSGHKISSLKVVFDFLSANAINLEHRQAKRKIGHRNG